jgi:hypothetical protein
MKLTTEQEFFIEAVKHQIKTMPREQLEAEFVRMLQVAMEKEETYRAMILESAGIL